MSLRNSNKAFSLGAKATEGSRDHCDQYFAKGCKYSESIWAVQRSWDQAFLEKNTWELNQRMNLSDVEEELRREKNLECRSPYQLQAFKAPQPSSPAAFGITGLNTIRVPCGMASAAPVTSFFIMASGGLNEPNHISPQKPKRMKMVLITVENLQRFLCAIKDFVVVEMKEILIPGLLEHMNAADTLSSSVPSALLNQRRSSSVLGCGKDLECSMSCGPSSSKSSDDCPSHVIRANSFHGKTVEVSNNTGSVAGESSGSADIWKPTTESELKILQVLTEVLIQIKAERQDRSLGTCSFKVDPMYILESDDHIEEIVLDDPSMRSSGITFEELATEKALIDYDGMSHSKAKCIPIKHQGWVTPLADEGTMAKKPFPECCSSLSMSSDCHTQVDHSLMTSGVSNEVKRIFISPKRYSGLSEDLVRSTLDKVIKILNKDGMLTLHRLDQSASPNSANPCKFDEPLERCQGFREHAFFFRLLELQVANFPMTTGFDSITGCIQSKVRDSIIQSLMISRGRNESLHKSSLLVVKRLLNRMLETIQSKIAGGHLSLTPDRDNLPEDTDIILQLLEEMKGNIQKSSFRSESFSDLVAEVVHNIPKSKTGSSGVDIKVIVGQILQTMTYAGADAMQTQAQDKLISSLVSILYLPLKIKLEPEMDLSPRFHTDHNLNLCEETFKLFSHPLAEPVIPMFRDIFGDMAQSLRGDTLMTQGTSNRCSTVKLPSPTEQNQSAVMNTSTDQTNVYSQIMSKVVERIVTKLLLEGLQVEEELFDKTYRRVQGYCEQPNFLSCVPQCELVLWLQPLLVRHIMKMLHLPGQVGPSLRMMQPLASLKKPQRNTGDLVQPSSRCQSASDVHDKRHVMVFHKQTLKDIITSLLSLVFLEVSKMDSNYLPYYYKRIGIRDAIIKTMAQGSFIRVTEEDGKAKVCLCTHEVARLVYCKLLRKYGHVQTLQQKMLSMSQKLFQCISYYIAIGIVMEAANDHALEDDMEIISSKNITPEESCCTLFNSEAYTDPEEDDVKVQPYIQGSNIDEVPTEAGLLVRSQTDSITDEANLTDSSTSTKVKRKKGIKVFFSRVWKAVKRACTCGR